MGWVVRVTHRPCSSPGERTPGNHFTGGWVSPRAGLDTEVRGKILSPLPEFEPRSPGSPARSQTLYWLSYSGYRSNESEVSIGITHRLTDQQTDSLIEASLTRDKILRQRTDGFASIRRKSWYGFLLPLKIHPPRAGFNPRTLVPLTSTITTRSPRLTTPMYVWQFCSHAKLLFVC
jgi:hypothetical protein